MPRRRRAVGLSVVPPVGPPPLLSPDRAPAHLSPESQQLWSAYLSTWSFDLGGMVVLQIALEALDSLRGAQAAIERDGLTVAGRAHPAATVAKDSRQAMLRALRQLGLDVIPPESRGGPHGGR
jgi:hypothetical protein